MRQPDFALLGRESTTQVFLLRHGESTFNQQGRYQGCCDEPVLTERGVRTAFQTGCYLRSQWPDVILSSPLRRARQTAEMILSSLGENASRRFPALVFHELLKEIHLPLWEGLTFHQVRSEFSRDYGTWVERPHLLRMPVGANGKTPAQIRPVADLYRHAADFWNEVLPACAGKRALVVSHGGTTRALVGTALGIPARFYHRTQHSNGGITILRFNGVSRRGSRIEALNLTGHLGERLPKLKEGKRGVRLVLLPVGRAGMEPISVQRLLDGLKPDFVVSAASRIAIQGQREFRSVGEETLRRWRQRSVGALIPPLLSAVAGSMLTGVVIAPAKSLLPALLSATGAKETDRARWSVRDGHLSVLHYPDPDGSPVLQALNIPVGVAASDARQEAAS